MWFFKNDFQSSLWVKLDLCCSLCAALQAGVSGYTVAWSATGRCSPSIWLGPIVCQRPGPDSRWPRDVLTVSGYRNIAQLMQKINSLTSLWGLWGGGCGELLIQLGFLLVAAQAAAFFGGGIFQHNRTNISV